MSKRWRPEIYHGGLALVFTLAGVLILFVVARLPWTWYHLLAAWLLMANLVTFAYYGHDKALARTQRRRVPEAVLHGLTLAGGTLGAYAGMRVFRHKTLKPTFRLIFWLIAVLQVGLILAVLYRLWQHRH